MSFTSDAELIGPWVCERAGGDWTKGRGTALGMLEDGRLVAGVLYEDWNGANILQHIALEKGFSRQFLGLIFQYPFIQLKVKRITAPITASNKRCIKLVEKLGFQLEAVLKDATQTGDMLIYVMWKENCRYLDDRYGDFFVKYK